MREKDDRRTLYFTYYENPEMIQEPEEGSGNWLHRGGYHLNWTLDKCYADEPKHTPYYHRAYLVGDQRVGTVYAVSVIYGDGDTFGFTRGRGRVVQAYSDPDKAMEAQTAIWRDNDSKRGILYKGKRAFNVEETYEGYVFWDDYFGGLESVHVKALNIL